MKMKERSRTILKLICNILLFFAPFVACMVLYFHDDPFRVMHRYHDFDAKVQLNESYVGWNIFMNNRKRAHVNSFIFGNSCTMAYPCKDWEQYLAGGHAVRLYANAEGIKGIDMKLRALERFHAPIKNVLMVIDFTTLRKISVDDGYSHILPPAISGGKERDFQLTFIQGFFKPAFLVHYLFGRLTGHYSSSWGDFNTYGRIINPQNNDEENPREKMIAEEGQQYWTKRMNTFPQRTHIKCVREPVIFKPQLAILSDMASILRRNHTSVKVIINPEFVQKQINPKDLDVLYHLFGRSNVFDFTGINRFSSDIHNFYEPGHYRPLLGRQLLKIVYQKR